MEGAGVCTGVEKVVVVEADTFPLPTNSSSLTYRVVLGKQDLSEADEAGSLAVGVDKIIVHEKWNSYLVM